MSPHRCCADVPDTRLNSRRSGFARRGLDRVRWVLPAAGLALIPKCPACLAAYIAIGTGFGVSMTAAAELRIVMLAVCIASLGYLAVRPLRRFFGRHHRESPLSHPLRSSI